MVDGLWIFIDALDGAENWGSIGATFSIYLLLHLKRPQVVLQGHWIVSHIIINRTYGIENGGSIGGASFFDTLFNL